MKGLNTKLAAIAAAAVAAGVVVGCGSNDEKSDTTASATVATAEEKSAVKEFGEGAIALGQSIGEMRGHYIAAKELYAKKDYEGAKVHADHPVDELYKSFRQAIAERDPELDSKVKANLDEAVELAEKKAPAAEFDKLVDNTSGSLMDKVFEVAQPDVDQNDPLFKAATAAGIITTAAGEYQAAAPKGKIKLVAEYQDSYGFLQYCQLLSDQLSKDLGAEKATVDGDLAKLADGPYKSGVVPPASPEPAAVVEKGTAAVASGFEKAFNAQLITDELDPEAEIDAIVAKLEEAQEAYDAGEKRAAEDLASQAYIDHFEELEGPLAEKNHELMEELEKQIGVDIPKLIRDGASAEQVSSAIEKVVKELPEASRALGAKSNSSY